VNGSFVHFTHADLLAIAPEIALLAAGCLILLVEAFAPALRRWFATIAMAGVAISLYFLVNAPAGLSFGGRYDTSPLTVFVGLFLGAAAALAILVARPYLERTGEERGEFYALLLWGHLGVSLMTRGLDLLIIFIGLETLSLAFYTLAGFFRRVAASSEAALKYFLTGAFGSAFTLYGVALLFGAAGGTKIEELARPGLADSSAVIFGLLFLLVGFGFKMSLAPFHAWAPDVYQGMPTPAVAYLSVAPKGAALLVLFRAFSAVFENGMPDRFRLGIAALAILSMTLGNVVALAQRDVKRLLAYSGIAQMGYVTIALAVFGREALAAALVYFCAYLVSNAGAFACVSAMYRDETQPHPTALLAGAGRRTPFAAAVFALCLFSLAGIPATAGFIGKFFLFKAAIEKGFYALALIGVANSLVSIGYYLKVVYILYMRDPVDADAPPTLAPADRLALALCAAGILAIGVFPSTLWEVARRAAATLPFAGP
jgi:NADH-quinone oxidoreductase subunit N